MNIRLLASLALCILMGGCGFHLRGSNGTSANIEALTVTSGSPYGKMARSMEKQIKIQHIKTGTPDSWHLQIISEKFNSNILAYDDSIYPSTYERTLEVRFSVTNAAGEMVIVPNTERVVRVMESDSDRRLAMDRQDDLLESEMYEEMAQNLLRRIDFIASKK